MSVFLGVPKFANYWLSAIITIPMDTAVDTSLVKLLLMLMQLSF